MPENNDTIAAIATPSGRGGIGVIRVSGKTQQRNLQSTDWRPSKTTSGAICFL